MELVKYRLAEIRLSELRGEKFVFSYSSGMVKKLRRFEHLWWQEIGSCDGVRGHVVVARDSEIFSCVDRSLREVRNSYGGWIL